MGYPFNDNPLNKYLTELRELRKEEVDAYRILINSISSISVRREYANKISAVKDRIRVLRVENELPARSFDIYLCEVDLALEKFKKEFPLPNKPEKCSHPSSSLRLKIHADKTSHIVIQCIVCGGILKDRKKSTVVGWESLPQFDENLERDIDVKYRWWWDKRNEIVKEHGYDDERLPEFDYDAYTEKYKSKTPEPLSPEKCNHSNAHLTLRKYSESNISVVFQCKDCGKHIKNVPKRDVSNIGILPKFDVTIEKERNKEFSSWFIRFINEQKISVENFRSEVLEKIRSGEIEIIDNSTFGTYYTSIEWGKTRERIFKRDEHKCQSCGANSECVHHITYDRLGRENDLDLISLCNVCHDEVHRHQDLYFMGFRLTPDEIRKVLGVRFRTENL